jgi:hypothetical protein
MATAQARNAGKEMEQMKRASIFKVRDIVSCLVNAALLKLARSRYLANN